jgi:hypothetical protein
MSSGFRCPLVGGLDLSQANHGRGSTLDLFVHRAVVAQEEKCSARPFGIRIIYRRNKCGLRVRPGLRFRTTVQYGTLGQLPA